MGLKKSKLSVMELKVDSYGVNGEGVARLPDGMACFVQGGLPGEHCTVRLDKVGKSAAWGHVEKILIPSPDRVKPDCPYHASCGGCMTRHMSYSAELAFKAKKVRDCLTRIGDWDPGPVVIHGAESTERYRNKVQFPISENAIGFYAARSHTVTDVTDCLLQPFVCSQIRWVVKEYMSTYRIPAYDERTGKGLLRHLYVRVNRREEVLVCLLVNGKGLPHEAELVEALLRSVKPVKGIVLGVNERRSNVILGNRYRTLWGENSLMDELCGLKFRLSVPSFYQVNALQTEILYKKVLDFAAITEEETVLDLYCGIGTITLCLAKKAKQVIGVEVIPEAIADAKENAQRNEIENVEFFCGDAADIAVKLATEGVRPDVVTVDPPRKGLAEEVIVSIVEMEPKRLIYVSCNPATMGRDIERFAKRGYQAIRVEAVDLFPRTIHVETVVLMSRVEK